MKKGIIIGPIVFTLCSFIWSGLNTFSQDVKKTNNPLIKKTMEAKRDSVKVEQLLDTIAAQRARKDSNIEKSAELVDSQKVLAEDLKQTNYLLIKLIRAKTNQPKEIKEPDELMVIEKKKPQETQTNLRAPRPDSLIIPIKKRSFWDKIFFRHK